MGSWSVSCGISNIAITSGRDCCILPLKKNRGGYGYYEYTPASLPIFGEYNDYGEIENIVEDDNTCLISKYFGVSISDFCDLIVNGKHFYDRDEARDVFERIKSFNEDKAKEVSEFKFMWIDKEVYDFFSKPIDKYFINSLKNKERIRQSMMSILSHYQNDIMEIAIKMYNKSGNEDIKKLIDGMPRNGLSSGYFGSTNDFDSRIIELLSMSSNLHQMSGDFRPHTLYLTPQCGEFKNHQVILDKFAEINKKYIKEYEHDN